MHLAACQIDAALNLLHNLVVIWRKQDPDRPIQEPAGERAHSILSRHLCRLQNKLQSCERSCEICCATRMCCLRSVDHASCLSLKTHMQASCQWPLTSGPQVELLPDSFCCYEPDTLCREPCR